MSVKAFHHQRSFHFVTTLSQGSRSELEVGNVSDSAADETLQSGQHPIIDAVRLPEEVYVRTDTQFLEQDLHLSSALAQKYSGKWLSVSHSATLFGQVAADLSATSAISLFVPEEPGLRLAGTTTFSGHRALAVQGSAPVGSGPGETSTVTLFVSTSRPFLPIGATLEFSDAEGKVVERAATLYGRWNERVDPVAPAGSVPLPGAAGQ